MLPVDLPTPAEVLALARERSDACVSIYIETTPITREIEASQIAYSNAVREAIDQLETNGLDKRRIWPLREQLDDLLDDTEFWIYQARSLCVLATPEHVTTFRLANRLTPMVQVADRFHVKPLLRAITHCHNGYVLALSENGARLIEFFADMAPVDVAVPDMPRDAASAVSRASINDRSPSGRMTGSEGKKVWLRQYARKVDAALRPVLAGETAPLILAANPPLAPIFRSLASYRPFVAETLDVDLDRMNSAELVAEARPLMDAYHAAELADRHALFSRRTGQERTTTDPATAARAAAQGAIEMLLVDMEASMPGLVDEDTGAIAYAETESAESYGVVDQIAIMALATGAEVMSVRADDLPHPGPLAATLRYRL